MDKGSFTSGTDNVYLRHISSICAESKIISRVAKLHTKKKKKKIKSLVIQLTLISILKWNI